MTLSTQEADDDSHYILVAKMDNAKNMSNILKAIHFKDVSRKSHIIAHVNIYHRNTHTVKVKSQISLFAFGSSILSTSIIKCRSVLR